MGKGWGAFDQNTFYPSMRFSNNKKIEYCPSKEKEEKTLNKWDENSIIWMFSIHTFIHS